MLLLIGIFVALTSNWTRDSAAEADEKESGPKEITVMLSDLIAQIEMATTASQRDLPQQKRFVNTDSNRASKTKPENARYESDRNTVAAGKLNPNPDLPVTEGVTMRGDERIKTLELQARKFSETRSDSQHSASGEKSKNSFEKVFTDANSSSLTRAPALESERLAKGSVVEQRKSSVNGTLSNKGKDAVDAVKTPLGRYKKAVTDAVAEKWHSYREQSADPVTWGTLRLQFIINPEGKVMNLKVTENEGNELLLDLTLKAIAEAEFEPMSDEVAAQLGASGLTMKYDVIIY